MVKPALENSLDRISRELENSYANNRKESVHLLEQISKTIAKKLNTTTEQLYKQAIANNRKFYRTMEKQAIEEQERLIREQVANNSVVKLYTKFTKGASFAKSSIQTLTSSLESSQTPLTTLANNIANTIPLFGIMSGVSVAVTVLEKYTQGFAKLTQSGITVSDGIIGTGEAAARLGLSFDDGVKMLYDNRLVVNEVGIPALTNFVDRLRNGGNELYAMGLNVSDVAEKSVQYLSIQRKLNRENIRDITRRETGFNEQLKAFYTTSQIVGRDLGSLMDSLEKSTEDPLMRIFLDTLPPEVQTVIADLNERLPNISKALMQAYFRNNVQAVDDYDTIVTAGAAPLLEELVAKMHDSTAGANERILGVFSEYSQFMGQRALQAGQLLQDGVFDMAAELYAYGADLNMNANATVGEIDNQTAKLLQTQAATVNLVRNIQVTMLEQLKDVDFDVVTANIQELAKNFTDLKKAAVNYADVETDNTVFGVLRTGVNTNDDDAETTEPEKSNFASFQDALTQTVKSGFAIAMASPILIAAMYAYADLLNDAYDTASSGLDGPNDDDDERRRRRREEERRRRRTTRNRSWRNMIGRAKSFIGRIGANLYNGASSMFKLLSEQATRLAGSAAQLGKRIAQYTTHIRGVMGSAVAKVSSLLTSSLGKFASKTLLKKLPIVGLFVALGLAAERFVNGEYISAIGEILSGLASTFFPGIGAGISLAIDGLIELLNNAGSIIGESDVTIPGEKPSILSPSRSQAFIDFHRNADTAVSTEPLINDTVIGGNAVDVEINEPKRTEIYDQMNLAKQQLIENRQAELAEIEEMPDVPAGLNRYERRQFYQERARMQREIIENYKDRNDALRAAINAMQKQIVETDRLNGALPDYTIAP